MKGRIVILGAVVAMAAAPMQASAQCSGQAGDACQKATDLVTFLAPQLAGGLPGGNHTLGQGGALGGLGHWALDVRATGVMGSFPKLDNVGFNPNGNHDASTFAATDQFVPGLVADAAIGLWNGYSLGVTHVGAIDALVSATYLPNVSGGDVSLNTSGSNLKFGYGVRIGLLEESVVTPGVAFSYLTRSLPTFSVSGNVAATSSRPGGTIALNDFSLKSSGWRLTAGKDLLIFNLNAGIGQDTYTSDANIVATVSGSGINATSQGSSSFTMTRTNMFVGASLNVFVAKLAVEAGQVTGGSVPTMTNSFGSDAAKARTYLSAGLRFGF
ncbi:MAG: hypothetical protein HYR75_03035 [Gemmatimonadetes bacterium]|nr:hypothetical protein [Gemmatimonadota bacterium]